MRGGRRPSVGGGGSGQRLKLLAILAEDDMFALELVQEALEAAGFSVLRYCSTIGLRALILREKPAVLVIAKGVQPLGGLSTISALRAHPTLKATRVLLYADEPEPQLERLAKECGADAWSPKDPEIVALRAASLVLRDRATREREGG